MKMLDKIAVALLLTVLSGMGLAFAQTYVTYDSTVKVLPTSYETYKGAGTWNDNNASFAGVSSAKCKKLKVTLSNVTSTETYSVLAFFTGKPDRNYQVFHDAKAANLDAKVSSRAASGDTMNLSSAYDRAKNAVSLAEVSTRFGNISGEVGRRLLASAYTPPPTVGQIDTQISGAHGAGPWGSSGSITILPFQGAVSYETVSQGKDVHVTRGDSVSIPYSIGKDITGWTVWFGAKANPADTAYAIPLKEVTASVTAGATGSGLINLSTTDTAVTIKRYYAELEIRNGSSVNTALKFYLWIDNDVVR
jgi:hypothetical protein